MPKFKVPEVVVERLSIYLRALKKLSDEHVLSSQELAELVGTTDVQVRKDLAYFGEFGIPGQGYCVGKLKEEIARILALGLKKKEFQIKAVFDNDPEKIGKKIEGLTIRAVEEICEVLPRYKIKIGIITTPAEAAQEIANRLVQAGVEGILNFAPVHITVPNKVKLKNVDLSMELEILSYFLSKEIRKER